MSFSTSSEQARKLVNEMYAAWSHHEPDRVETIFHDEAVHEDVAGGHICHGKTEIKQLLRDAFAFSSDFRCTLMSLAIAGDRRRRSG